MDHGHCRPGPKSTKDFATTTDGFYGLSIKRIKDGDNPDRAVKILAWILRAKRALRVVELQHALAVQPGNTSISDYNDFLVREEVLVNCCAGLVSMAAESRIVTFSHPTVKEYLETGKVRKELFAVEPDVEISRACLTYLSYDVFDGSLSYLYIITFKDYPLLRYATTYWMEHAQGEHEGQVADMALEYLGQRSKRSFCIDAINQTVRQIDVRCWTGKGWVSEDLASEMWFAAYFGLTEVAKTLLKRDPRLASRIDQGKWSSTRCSPREAGIFGQDAYRERR
jgi:hypothetical protein